MKRSWINVAAMCVLAVTLSACGTAQGNKGKYGAAGGAAAGALFGQAIGGNTESTLIGAGVGTMLGYIVGNEMDKYDAQQLQNGFEQGRSNQPISWQNPDTQTQYTMTPGPSYQGQSGQYCRDAKINAVIDGQSQVTHTTACRDSYGNWQLQS